MILVKDVASCVALWTSYLPSCAYCPCQHWFVRNLAVGTGKTTKHLPHACQI